MENTEMKETELLQHLINEATYQRDKLIIQYDEQQLALKESRIKAIQLHYNAINALKMIKIYNKDIDNLNTKLHQEKTESPDKPPVTDYQQPNS